MPKTIAFCDGLKQSWTAQSLPVSQYHDQQAECFGHPQFNRFELLHASMLVHPYFDMDAYSDAAPSDSLVKQQEEAARQNVIKHFKMGDSLFCEDHVLVATRHGMVPAKQKFKISVRVYVTCYSIALQDMAALVKAFQEPGLPQGDFWDEGVYSTRQKLGIVGACKGDGDWRVLTPLGDWEPSLATVQHLTGTEQQLAAQPRKAPAKATINDEAWEEVVPHLEARGFREPRLISRKAAGFDFTADNKGVDCPCCPWVHDRCVQCRADGLNTMIVLQCASQCCVCCSNNWYALKKSDGSFCVKSYSPRCEGVYIMTPDQDPQMTMMPRDDLMNIVGAAKTIIHTVTPILEGTMNSVLQDTDMTAEQSFTFSLLTPPEFCSLCNQKHGNSPYSCSAYLSTCCQVRNIQPTCRDTILGWEKEPLILDIIENFITDQPYTQLYMALLQWRGNRGIWDSLAKQFFVFDGVTWKKQTEMDMQTNIRHDLHPFLRALSVQAHVEHVDTGKELKKKQSANLTKAVLQLKNSQKMHRLSSDCKVDMNQSGFADKLDGQWNLLGTDNGVVDLETCTFRSATPEDMVSLSVGYTYVEADDPEAVAGIENFMCQVYPDTEERKLMKKLMGYFLLGKHNEKVMPLLTDERQGYNGKSTVMGLLLSTMGGYARKTDACLYYRNDKVKSIDDHSAGLLSFKKVRLAVIEEMAPDRHLDQQFCKDANGGGGRQSGRGAYQMEILDFPWITKTLCAFNEGKMPMFDVDDSALVERMVTICHRSRFYPGEVPDEPHSYPADPDIKQKFETWRPHMLKYMLEGLKDYHREGFRDVPSTCLAFKKKLVGEKDFIQEFLASNIEQGEDKDFVKVCDLFGAFSEQYRSLQQDKRTKKNMKDFEKGLKRCLGANRFKDRYQPRVNGKQVAAGRVFLNFRQVKC